MSGTGALSDTGEFAVGDTVLAHWEQGSFFVGTVVEEERGGFRIVFEDGDTKVMKPDEIRQYDIGVGSRVAARWQGGGFYDGEVAEVVGRVFFIHYDDGDRGWAPMSWIAQTEEHLRSA